MARSTALRNLFLVAVAVFAAQLLGRSVFVPPAVKTTTAATAGRPETIAGVAGLAAYSLGAAPAFAAEKKEELGFLNFGKIELGGGFAINLDIPETGIVNIAVLIAGLLYLLGPLLSNSMETREQEINQDIDDAIAKWEEANARFAEAQKNQSQAEAVIAEIEGSIEKDKAAFRESLEEQTEKTMTRQQKATEALMKSMEAAADEKVTGYIERSAIEAGVKELLEMKDKQQDAFMDAAIDAL